MVAAPEGAYLVANGKAAHLVDANGIANPLGRIRRAARTRRGSVVLTSDDEFRTSKATGWRPLPSSRPYAVAPVGEGFATGGVAGEVALWRTLEGEAELLRGHRQYVEALAEDPSGRFLATGAWDETIWLWDLSSKPPTGRKLADLGAAVMELVWSADGKRLYSVDHSGRVRVHTDPAPTDPDALRTLVHRAAEAIRDGAALPEVASAAGM